MRVRTTLIGVRISLQRMSGPDPLSQALRSVRRSGAIFLDSAELSAPWGFASPPASAKRASLGALGIGFHPVSPPLVEGEATARITWQGSDALPPGDIAALPGGDAHELWNGRMNRAHRLICVVAEDSSRRAVASHAWWRRGSHHQVHRLATSAANARPKRLFLAGLPPLFKVNIRRDASGGMDRHYDPPPRLGARSRPAPGRSALLAKLAEALFIETLRRYMAELPRQLSGWLAGARDSAVGRALGAIHREPARAWTVASLAQQAGVSRTVFAERFTRLLGEAPLSYISRCRMQLGARLLETTDDTVLRVALNAGYESEAAF